MNEYGEFNNGEESVENTENAENCTPNEETNFENNDGFDNVNAVDTFEYSPVEEVRDTGSRKGLRIFSVILAIAVALSASCTVGYFFGRNSMGVSKKSINLNLAAKPSQKNQYTPAQVYDSINSSVVGIRVYNDAGLVADASGVVYSEDGYIVTNDHIYSEIPLAKFRVYMHNGDEYDATYVAGDSISDLAVLKIEKAKGLKVPTFGDSSQLICGESVVAIGRPSSATDNSSITSGIISLTKRRVQTTSSYTASLIQTDSAINPGSSGGALVNLYGQIVGITSSKLAGVEYDAVGFAIPTVTVKRVTEQLIKDGKVTNRAKLGISYTEITSVTAKLNGNADTGLYVATVSEDSDLAGKVFEGDIITHINGQKITTDDMVLDVIEECYAGDSITLTVLSTKGNSTEYKVKLKANIGQSSYSTSNDSLESPQNGNGNSSGGTFDFPNGE